MVNTTLVIHHVFSALSLIIMTLRLICRRTLYHEFNFGDFCTMAAMLCAAARDGSKLLERRRTRRPGTNFESTVIHVVLTWGTNNITTAARKKMKFTPEEIYRRTIGSQLTISNRPVYNS